MKPEQNHITRFIIVLALLASLSLAGCAASGPQAAEGKAAETASATEQPVEPWDGDGMEIPLDGSSTEAWNRSLARVKEHVDEDTYTTLENAIDYLLLYDIGARNDREQLISRLDGMTGYEILAKVRWRAPRPGTGPAEKDSKEASLIDKGRD